MVFYIKDLRSPMSQARVHPICIRDVCPLFFSIINDTDHYLRCLDAAGKKAPHKMLKMGHY